MSLRLKTVPVSQTRGNGSKAGFRLRSAAYGKHASAGGWCRQSRMCRRAATLCAPTWSNSACRRHLPLPQLMLLVQFYATTTAIMKDQTGAPLPVVPTLRLSSKQSNHLCFPDTFFSFEQVCAAELWAMRLRLRDV